MKIGALRLLGRLFKGNTPGVGKKIRALGGKLLAGSAATAGASVTLPDAPDSWVEMARVILEILTVVQAIAGLFIVGVGQAQTDEVVDAQ